MDTIPPSGYYYPNKIARIFLQAMEEIMGKNGLNAVLNMAKQPHLIDNYPIDNLEKEFDFAQFSALNGAWVGFARRTRFFCAWLAGVWGIGRGR